MVREIWKGRWLIMLSISKERGQDNANDQTLSDLTQSQTCAESHSVFVGINLWFQEETLTSMEPFHCTADSLK